jgi:hypothetical protein
MNFRGAVKVMSVREVAISGVGVIARVGMLESRANVFSDEKNANPQVTINLFGDVV